MVPPVSHTKPTVTALPQNTTTTKSSNKRILTNIHLSNVETKKKINKYQFMLPYANKTE